MLLRQSFNTIMGQWQKCLSENNNPEANLLKIASLKTALDVIRHTGRLEAVPDPHSVNLHSFCSGLTHDKILSFFV